MASPAARSNAVSYIQYIAESLVVISIPNAIVFISLNIVFVLANTVDPDEMPHCRNSGSALFAEVRSIQNVKSHTKFEVG